MSWIKQASPTRTISLLAVLISLGGAGVAATGGTFILGRGNSASTTTGLGANISGGGTLAVTNGGTASGSTALVLSVRSNRPPIRVNSRIRIPNLNADLVDSVSPNDFNRLSTTAWEFPSYQDGVPFASADITTTLPNTYVNVRAGFYTYLNPGQSPDNFPCLTSFLAQLDGVLDINPRGVTTAASPPSSLYESFQEQVIEAVFLVSPGTHTVELIPFVETGACEIVIGRGRLTAQLVAYNDSGFPAVVVTRLGGKPRSHEDTIRPAGWKPTR